MVHVLISRGGQVGMGMKVEKFINYHMTYYQIGGAQTNIESDKHRVADKHRVRQTSSQTNIESDKHRVRQTSSQTNIEYNIQK